MGIRTWAAAAALSVCAWAGQAGAAVYTVDLTGPLPYASFDPVTIHPGDTLSVYLTLPLGPIYDPADYYYITIFGGADLSGHTEDGAPVTISGVWQIQATFNPYKGAPRNFLVGGGGYGYNVYTGENYISAYVQYLGPRFDGDGVTFNLIQGGVAAIPAAVPEPSTWAMMLIGFAGLGAVAKSGQRRRRKQILIP